MHAHKINEMLFFTFSHSKSSNTNNNIWKMAQRSRALSTHSDSQPSPTPIPGIRTALLSPQPPGIYIHAVKHTHLNKIHKALKKNFRKKIVIPKQPVFCRAELYLVLDSLCLSLFPNQQEVSNFALLCPSTMKLCLTITCWNPRTK